MTRAEVLQGLLALFQHPRYLEIGVNAGETFFAISAAHKVAVDPDFLFDMQVAQRREPKSEFYQVESDEYFGSIVRSDQLFDVIYIDGLHTFEQTLRDFCSASGHLANGGIVVVDDVRPNSYAASLSNLSVAEQLKAALGDSDASWMGDVYKLVFFIESFFQGYSYATITDNHGQLIAWREPRRSTERRSVEEVARKPFESVALEAPSFQLRGYGEVLDHLRRRSRQIKL